MSIDIFTALLQSDEPAQAGEWDRSERSRRCGDTFYAHEIHPTRSCVVAFDKEDAIMSSNFIRRMLVAALFVCGCADVPMSDPQNDAHGIESNAAEDTEDELATRESALQSVDASVSPRRTGFSLRSCANQPGLGCPSDQACVGFSDGCPDSRNTKGYCQPRAKVCPQLVAPVCGCNGKTYANACEAADDGASVQYRGTCGVDGPSCGGVAGIACPGLGECIDDPSDNCDPRAGGADCKGVCICRDHKNLSYSTGHYDPNGSSVAFFDARPKICAVVRSYVR